MESKDLYVSLSVVALVPAIFGINLPPVATVRAEADYGGHQAAGLRSAVLTAGAVVAVTAAVTRSAPVLIVGAIAITAQAVAYGHAIPRG